MKCAQQQPWIPQMSSQLTVDVVRLHTHYTAESENFRGCVFNLKCVGTLGELAPGVRWIFPEHLWCLTNKENPKGRHCSTSLSASLQVCPAFFPSDGLRVYLEALRYFKRIDHVQPSSDMWANSNPLNRGRGQQWCYQLMRLVTHWSSHLWPAHTLTTHCWGSQTSRRSYAGIRLPLSTVFC